MADTSLWPGGGAAVEVIERNQKLYARNGIEFDVSPERFEELPAAGFDRERRASALVQ